MTTLRLKSALPPEKMAALFPNQPAPAPAPTAPAQPAQSTRQSNMAVAKTDIKKLKKLFPVFADCKPLAIGVFESVKAAFPDKSNSRLGRAMHRHTRSIDYLRHVATNGAMRHNLAGEPVEPVSDNHRTWAAEELAKLETRQ